MTRERYEALQMRVETLERERSAWELERAAWLLAATARFGLVGQAASAAISALRRRLPV